MTRRPLHYLFTWAGPTGPAVKTFACPVLFDAWVKTWRESWGPVDFDTPWIARGAL